MINYNTKTKRLKSVVTGVDSEKREFLMKVLDRYRYLLIKLENSDRWIKWRDFIDLAVTETQEFNIKDWSEKVSKARKIIYGHVIELSKDTIFDLYCKKN